MSGYETALLAAVEAAGLHQPALILDQARLNANLSYLRANLPAGHRLRIADKSLPVPDLLAFAFDGFDTQRVMSFHLPLTAQLLDRFPGAQVLMGKPMPVGAAAQFMASPPDASQITWLIDSAARLEQYRALAAQTSKDMRAVFEVDIGLGRGGLETPDDLDACLRDSDPLKICGVMGYEAHVNALPKILGRGQRAQKSAMSRLGAFVAKLGPDQRQIINTGGSSTALGLPTEGPANDLTIGSLLVKPSDFDQALNHALKPALFIVTPVLKTCKHGLPGHPNLSGVLRSAGAIRRRIVFSYGGKWMAKPIYPAGLTQSPFFAPSSNQQGFCLPNNAHPPSHIILRPTQSEAVLQHFAELHIFDGEAICKQMRPFAIC